MSIISNSPEIMFAADRLRKAPNGQRMAEFQKIVEEGKTNFAAVAAAMELVKKAERMSQQPSQRPTTTVAEDLEAKLSQINQAKKREEQGIAGLPNDLMANANFSSGITSGMAEEPPPQQMNMAGGGIVAFSAGGPSIDQLARTLGVTPPQLSELAKTLGISEEDLSREFKNPESRSKLRLQLSELLKKGNMPSFAKQIESPGRFVRGVGSLATRFGPGAGTTTAGISIFDEAANAAVAKELDPEGYAREWGVNLPTPVAGIVGGLGDLVTLGNWETPSERVYASAKKDGTQQSNLSQMEKNYADAFGLAVRKFGEYSPQAQEIQRQYRAAKGLDQSTSTEADILKYFQDRGSEADIYASQVGALSGIKAPTYDELMSGFTGTKPDEAAIRQELIDREEAMGIGASRKERLGKIEEEQKSLESKEKKGTWLAIADAFFRATSAGERGVSTAAALAEGVSAGIKSYNELTDKIEERKNKLLEDQFRLKEAEELYMVNRDERAYSRYNQQLTNYNNDRREYANLKMQKYQIDTNAMIQSLDAATRVKLAQLKQKDENFVYETIGKISDDVQKKGGSLEEAKYLVRQFLDQVAEIERTSAGYQGIQYRADMANQKDSWLNQVMGGGGGTEGWGDVSVSGN